MVSLGLQRIIRRILTIPTHTLRVDQRKLDSPTINTRHAAVGALVCVEPGDAALEWAGDCA